MEDGVQHSLGTFDDLVMPCGLMNAPAVFQASVNDVLRDFLNSFFGRVSRWRPHFLPEPSDHILRSPGSPKALHQGQEMRVSRQKCTFFGRHHRERVGEDASRKGLVYCGRGCLSSLYCVRLSSYLSLEGILSNSWRYSEFALWFSFTDQRSIREGKPGCRSSTPV